MNTKFKVGDVVVLKSGSPQFVISGVMQADPSEPAWITVTWWNHQADEPRGFSMTESILMLAEDTK